MHSSRTAPRTRNNPTQKTNDSEIKNYTRIRPQELCVQTVIHQKKKVNTFWLPDLLCELCHLNQPDDTILSHNADNDNTYVSHTVLSICFKPNDISQGKTRKG
jgi:hypothetical protein